MNKEKIILHLCADTGSDSKVYKDNGYTVITIGSDIGVENYHPPKNVYGIIANPVCTEFSTARSDGKARNPEEGMKLVRECQRIIEEASAGGGSKILGNRKSSERSFEKIFRRTSLSV